MNRYVVISWDSDQRQTFYDVVPAPSESEAGSRIEAVRGGYADVIDTMSVSEFSHLSGSFQAMSMSEIDSVLHEIDLDSAIEQ